MQEVVPFEEQKPFEIEVSDFQFVRRNIKNHRALRFTFTWKLEHPAYGILGESTEGWLMTRDREGRLKVSPPLTRFGPMSTKQFTLITLDLHTLIINLIEGHKTKAGHSYADYVGNTSTAATLGKEDAQAPHEVDPELPEEILK